MLTGDNDTVARRVATEVGIEEFYAGLLPEQKLERVSQLTEGDQVSVMVGDGVNDAAALERATVGVAMGAIGYDAAIDSANIVLMRDDLRRLPEVIRLAHSLRGIVKQNFWIWGVSNVVGLSLVFTGVIGPVGAAAYNFLSDFIPLFNSLKVVRMWFGRSN
jgi:P-type E1-E2 ATPase